MSGFFSGRSGGGLAGGLPNGVKLAAIAFLIHQLMKQRGAEAQTPGGVAQHPPARSTRAAVAWARSWAACSAARAAAAQRAALPEAGWAACWVVVAPVAWAACSAGWRACSAACAAGA
ncbi:hypothetical protein ACFQU7_15770 [Pseudoroseomonas wenyumeiae]